MPLIGYPSGDLIANPSTAVVMSNEDSSYPVANARDNASDNTAKATGQDTVVDVELDLAGTPLAAGIVNTNASGWTLANDVGLSIAAVIPSPRYDGQLVNAWIDLRDEPNTTTRIWSYTVTKGGTAQLEVGRLILVSAIATPHIVIRGAGPSPIFGVRRPGQVENRTRLGSSPRRPSPVAIRYVRASSIESADYAIWSRIEAECLGLNRGFFFVPDEDVNDCWFAQIEMKDFEAAVEIPSLVVPVTLLIEEISMGLPPALT